MRRSFQPRAYHVQIAPFLMIVFAALGIADAFYDSYSIYTGQMLWCPPPIDGCNTVANSPYARIFGIPLGNLGVTFYLYMFALATLLLLDPFSRGLRLGAMIYAALGITGSFYFMYIQLAYIHAFCIYCLMSAVLTLLLVIAAIWHFRVTEEMLSTPVVNGCENADQCFSVS